VSATAASAGASVQCATQCQERSRSVSGRLVRSLEPNGYACWGTDGDQTAKKPLANLLGRDRMLKALAATDRDDLVDLISRIELELPPKAFCIRRLLRRRSKPEQLIAGPLGVLVGDIHDRVKLHPLMLAHLGRKRHTRIRSRSVTTSEPQ
jgi:hypothetical protein